MPAATAKKSARAISDESVARATGLGWDEWFERLDAAGAAKLSHREIVAIVSEPHVGAWWRQMVTVEYERARGLRVKHETPRGFSISASKTVAAPVAKAFAAWSSAAARRRWLSEDAPLTITTSTPGKSIRFKWDGASVGDVGFFVKGENKTQIAIGHEKLASAAAAARMKAFWKAQLISLQAVVER